MKTPQRKFVVEFKSPRRQSKTRTNSIWGDTDLKAFAREVEDQPSELNYSGKTENVLNASTVLLPPVDMGSAHETAGNVDAVQISNVSADDLKTDALPGINSGHPDVEAAVATQESNNAPEPLSTPEPRTTSKRARIIRSGRKQRSASSGDAVQPAHAEVSVEQTSMKLLRLTQKTSASSSYWSNTFVIRTCSSGKCLQQISIELRPQRQSIIVLT